MNGPLTLHSLAQFSADRLLNGMIEGVLIAFLAWAVLRLAGRQGSGTRFAVWFSALLAVAALPFFGQPGSHPAAASVVNAISLPHRWALYMFVGWAVLAMLALSKLALGLYGVAQLRSSCTPVDEDGLDPVLQQTLREFRGRRSVVLCSSERVDVPAAIGFFRPAVVIPAWSWDELSIPELNSILLHELAHLERYDDWTNLAQKFLRAVLFFHPAVWWIESKLALEREMACDDVVLAHTTSPRAYAECLVSLTEKGLLHRGLDLAQAAISRVRQTTLRVRQILDKSCPRATRVCKPAFVLIAVVASGGLLVSANAPRLVSFDPAPQGFELAKSQGTQSPLRITTHGPVVPASLTPVPASLEVQPTAAPRAINAAFHVTNSRKPVLHSVPQKHTPMVDHRSTAAGLVHTSLSSSQLETVQPRVMFLMMQTSKVYPDGSMVRTVTVFRFTSFEPVANPEINARKI